MKRRINVGRFLFVCGLVWQLTSWANDGKRPNIIYILADDLGVEEIGDYGQKQIRTPSIDRLAHEGIRLTQYYAGCAVCAPSRCTFLTGLHTGHAFIRDNCEMPNQQVNGQVRFGGQMPLPAETRTLPALLKQAGYATGCIGKWGLGSMDSSGSPLRQGFDFFYGYNCQRHAHNYYPQYLYRNDAVEPLDNPAIMVGEKLAPTCDPLDPASYAAYRGKIYAPDLMENEALAFIRQKKDKPFFLFFSTTLPHLGLQAPADMVEACRSRFPDEKPYLGGKGYVPCRYPLATYAAMVEHLDRSVGRMMALLDELGLAENTVICFSSDNGASFTVGGKNATDFAAMGARRGNKGDLYEGGLAAPCVVRWPGHIQPGTVSSHLSAMWDLFPTFCDVAGVTIPDGLDGRSFVATLTGQAKQAQHDALYWETARNKQALRKGDWKVILFHPSEKVELYNLADDPGETKNVAASEPERCASLVAALRAQHRDSAEFPWRAKKITGKIVHE